MLDLYNAGINSKLAVKQAELASPATRERIAQLQETIGLTRNQLAALLGQGPDRGLEIARPSARALGAVEIPSKLPAELLGRRPETPAQRWRVEAARKDIDVAKAEFYPNVSLTAFIDFQIGPPGFLQAANRTREPAGADVVISTAAGCAAISPDVTRITTPQSRSTTRRWSTPCATWSTS